MAATDLASLSGSGGLKPLSKTKGILLETMQLVAPKKDVPVPNHLLESKIYSTVAQNDVVQARPSVLHFGGFELGKTHRKVLRLANVSTEVQRMHIIPPQSKYFYIKYTKNERLVPGLTLDCVVEFTPDEWRYYYDCIRIHTKGEKNLVIPIHAYPVMSTGDFPTNISFSSVPVGQRKSQIIPLKSTAPIDFEFQLSLLQPHPAFIVDPMAGVVPAQGEVDICVTFAPTEFSTAHMKLQLIISQFNAKPLVCSFYGNSIPGLAKEISEESAVTENSVLDPHCISPIDRVRRKKRPKIKENTGPIIPKPEEVVIDGVRFDPCNLDTPYAVAQVLNQEPGKLKMKDLRQARETTNALIAKKGNTSGTTRQMKEAMFEMAVRQDVYEERQNQLRWQVKLGEDQMSSQKRFEVVEAREDAWREYRLKRGDPLEDTEYNRSCTKCSFRRTMRDSSQIGREDVKFDTYTNDMWAVRHAALNRFRQAARLVIVRTRADHHIKGLRDMVLNWQDQKFKSVPTANQKELKEEEKEHESHMEIILDTPQVKSVTFPTYAKPNVKDDMAVDALGVVPYKPTEVVIKRKVPFFELKVPQQYDIMGYRGHNIHEASSGYVPLTPVRALRSGAEDEVINLPAPKVILDSDDDLCNEGDVNVEEVTGETPAPPVQETTPLKPPSALFKPIEYPPLHIFNPSPGLQVFQAPLPYMEVDPDFHLCPLPRYPSKDSTNPHMATQKQYLDREDVVKGVMTWKRFPSQGLTSLASTPTLSSVWVPRWNDPFSDSMLPTDVPQLLEGLPEAEKENIANEDDSDDDARVQLTPEMVVAQFPTVVATPAAEDKKPKEDAFPFTHKLPHTNIPMSASGPVTREKREQELEYFLKKKYNRLGSKIQTKVDHLNSLKTNPDLILK